MTKTGLREKALQEVDKTRWLPAWGRDRIYGMLENRPDWCISRQRVWGVPLPFFFCNDCGESLVDATVARHIAEIFGEHGSDEWWKREAKELLPSGTQCAKCGSDSFSKEENIVDVWFESGVSWAAVCRGKEEAGLGLPIDLYLEGSDQHRGWFHTAMLTAVATIDKAPYNTVLTHGFICDEKGHKYSKSQKNFIPPQKTVEKDGAEIMRLWTSYADYRTDVPFSKEIVSTLVDSYRKIRNTIRFMLGNLASFEPETQMVAYAEMPELDRWMLNRFGQYLKRIERAYEDFEFHHIFHQTIELMTVDISSFYADIIKDRLYCDAPNSISRRSAQTVLFIMARDMLRSLSPVLSFTCDEAWQHLPKNKEHEQSVFLAGFPQIDEQWEDKSLGERWTTLRDIRRDVTKKLEALRVEGKIGNALEAHVEIRANAKDLEYLQSFGPQQLADIFLVSSVNLTDAPGEITIEPSRTTEEKCPRCWRHGHGVGQNSTHPELCSRCADVVTELITSGQWSPQEN